MTNATSTADASKIRDDADELCYTCDGCKEVRYGAYKIGSRGRAVCLACYDVEHGSA